MPDGRKRPGLAVLNRERARPESERFAEKVMPVLDGCHLWMAAVDRDGYGNFFVRGHGKDKAHRVSYRMKYGAIPEGLVIDHLCRQRSCVNPRHLRAVTANQNALENSESVLAINARKTHCIRGHRLVGANLKNTKNKQRHCRLCENMKRRERRASGKVN